MRRTENLTQRQSEILDCIRAFMSREQRPPTFREIGELCSIKSTNGVNEHLKALESKGYIKRTEGFSRGIQLLSKAGVQGDAAVPRLVPLLGRVAAGHPILAAELPDGPAYPLPPGLQREEKVFVLRVSGESMIGDGIFDGDLVYVRATPQVNNSDIAVVLIDDDVTLKRYYADATTVVLKPSNPAMQDLVFRGEDARNLTILGKVLGVLRIYG